MGSAGGRTWSELACSVFACMNRLGPNPGELPGTSKEKLVIRVAYLWPAGEEGPVRHRSFESG